MHSKTLSLTSALILLFASFGYFTIIPGLIDNYNLIMACLLTMLYFVRIMRCSIRYKHLAAFVFYGFLFIIHSANGAVHQLIVLALISLLLLVLTTLSVNDIKIFLKLYIIFALIWTVCGTLSWAIVNLNIIDIDFHKHIFELSSQTGGRMVRNINNNLFYLNPFGLGLVEVYHSAYEIMGISFLRASGWAHEPVTSSLYIMPAFLLAINVRLFSKTLNRLIISSLFIFIFAISQSITTLVAAIFISFIFFISLLNFPLRCFLILGVITIAFLSVSNADSIVENISKIGGFEGIPLLIKIYSNESYITQFDNPFLFGGIAIFSFLIPQFLIRLNNDGFKRALYFILLFYIVHIFKLDNASTFIRFNKLVASLFFVIWFYLFLSFVFPLRGFRHRWYKKVDICKKKPLSKHEICFPYYTNKDFRHNLNSKII